MWEVIKSSIAETWDNWYFQDVLVLVLVLVVGRIVWALAHKEYWRIAMRQVFRRKLIVVSFVILCLYAGVAVLDSIGYHPQIGTNEGTGEAVYDPDGLSALDWILAGLRESKEKSYSAPLGDKLFQKETMSDETGSTVRDYPPLQSPGKHLLGTDQVGNDVLYLSLKSIRTGMIIGAVTTMLVIPFAILFGIAAGYFGKWVDDIIQYFYTVLGSIPSLLLIASFMIIFGTGLPQLCIIMGITSWTGLCRVLRGETFKLREMEYVQAAEAMGVSRARIIAKHILPNVMHIVLITAVLGFSGRVLSETILTYLGIGVGADTISWGVMINNALGELARDPSVWWNLAAAFIFMLGLVLPANLFGDALRDALDPRLRTE